VSGSPVNHRSSARWCVIHGLYLASRVVISRFAGVRALREDVDKVEGPLLPLADGAAAHGQAARAVASREAMTAAGLECRYQAALTSYTP
jgi:hypothetical protein